MEETCRVVDGYTQKILNCGYIKEQTQRIVVDGIKRHDKGRRTKCRKLGRKGKSTVKESLEDRRRKKLLEWYRGEKEVGYYASGEKTKKYVVFDSEIQKNSKNTWSWEKSEGSHQQVSSTT